MTIMGTNVTLTGGTYVYAVKLFC